MVTHNKLVKANNESIDVDESGKMVYVLWNSFAELIGHTAFYADGESLLLFSYFLKLKLFQPVLGHQHRDFYLTVSLFINA
jgi:hypothetical protein